MRKAQSVAMYFALVDQALLALVNKFDRILDGQDVAQLILVFVIHHRSESGRLTRTGWSGNQYDASREGGYFLKDARRAQLFESQNFRRDGTKHSPTTTILIECIDTKSGQSRESRRRNLSPDALRSPYAACHS